VIVTCASAASHDAGISGTKGRESRPGLDEMLKDAQRRRFDVVMAWAIDRLGRSLIDLLGTIQALEGCGVDLYLDQQSIDTTTPAGRLMFQITGAFAEFERSMIRQRVRAGLKRAVESGRQLGRPNIDLAVEKRIQAQLRAKKGMLAIARDLKVGTGTVQRVKREMEAAGPFDEIILARHLISTGYLSLESRETVAAVAIALEAWIDDNVS
jgi:DNA invertase Pin-like site-specific DNA recombinase